ncbi:amidohydrolase [Vibrio sp. CAIM 722]|uniref:Amidohydrolase n=1 Tax=Vibrio eleionomae TaxID=2653505 RepID=A0A7X4RWH2_9VIBR|nr:amidohydrolase [Vibrio eleionomae]MZI95347.1 amidohydrolase [Vibrio eleionomae]
MSELLKLLEKELLEQFETAQQWHRDLHRHPQPGWLEFYSTATVAEKLANWGYEIFQGTDIIDGSHRLFVPPSEVLEQEYQAALDYGANAKYLAPAKGGLTGVVGVITGNEPGPTVAYRFDIDCLRITESTDPSRKAVQEEYVSCHPGFAHMCAHDINTCTGLMLAHYFAQHREQIKGSIKFIFQPDEEGLSGARTMIPKGVLDGVDYLMGGHVASNMPQAGSFSPKSTNILAVKRWKFRFIGQAAHSTGQPHLGKNALLGAANATLNLHAIAPHSAGTGRVNVGKIDGGDSWNIIAPLAELWVEIRASTDEVFNYLNQRVESIMQASADLYELGLDTELVVESLAGKNSPEMEALAAEVGHELSLIHDVVDEHAVNASEDFTLLADYVQSQGGQSVYVIHGTPVEGGLHSNALDVDERVMVNAAAIYGGMYLKLVH